MSPVSTGLARVRASVIALILVIAAAACAPAFDPSGPCTTDGRAPGAYPELEALVPRELGGESPTRVDSGRSCTPAALGSLVTHGVSELRFAGSTWERGPNSGITAAVFEAPDLTAEWVHEFFRTGAEAGRNTENVTASEVAVDGVNAFRLDTLNGESYQTVIDWQDGDRVRVVLVGSFIREVNSKAAHDRIVEAAAAAAMAAQDNR
jgi:hypothetical protein